MLATRQLVIHLKLPTLTQPQVVSELNKKGYMNREKILIRHWHWLEARGYKEQAASCKLQAASLTRKNYRIIKEYESKRSKTNNR